MISEGSCDTEDWSNNAENLDLHHTNTLHLKNIFRYKTVILNFNDNEISIHNITK